MRLQKQAVCLYNFELFTKSLWLEYITSKIQIQFCAEHGSYVYEYTQVQVERIEKQNTSDSTTVYKHRRWWYFILMLCGCFYS